MYINTGDNDNTWMQFISNDNTRENVCINI